MFDNMYSRKIFGSTSDILGQFQKSSVLLKCFRKHITLDIMMMNTKTTISPVRNKRQMCNSLLNNDVLEIITKLLLFSFPFMRNNLKAVNRFFRPTVDREPFPIIYIPKFPAEPTTISVRSIITLKGKRSRAVIRLKEIMAQAWRKLRPQSYGWLPLQIFIGRNKFIRG